MAKVPPSLPVKQRPFSSIAILGDSITSANYDWNTAGAPNYCYFADNGYLTHAQGLSGVEFNFLVDAGIGGNKTADMLARVYTDIIAYQPDVCIVMGGTNDANSVSVTQAIANIQGICSALRAANIAVILASPPAYSSATATQYKFLAALRRKIEAYAHATQGIWYWDVYGCTVNPTSSTGAYLSNYSDDNVHPNNLGAYKMGDAGPDPFTVVPDSRSCLHRAGCQIVKHRQQPAHCKSADDWKPFGVRDGVFRNAADRLERLDADKPSHRRGHGIHGRKRSKRRDRQQNHNGVYWLNKRVVHPLLLYRRLLVQCRRQQLHASSSTAENHSGNQPA